MITKSELPVSASIIAYNEEAIIADTIRHLLPYMREVVVCDTGSTDKTREQAAKAGARVVNIGWNQDFALARNKALAASRTDWVIQTDCDERVSSELINIIPDLIAYGNVDDIAVFYFWRISVFDGQNVGEEYQPRLLHRQRCQWVNKIHEGVSLVNGFRAKEVPKDFILRHEHTMARQRYNNLLYMSLSEGKVRPPRSMGAEMRDGKWVTFPNDGNA